MKIQVCRLAIAVAIAVPLAGTATAQSSAAPINGTSIKAAAPAVTTDVRNRVYRDYPYYYSDWGYPNYYYYEYSNDWYWSYPRYYYRWW